METEKMTIAETWLQKIDNPMPPVSSYSGISKKAVKCMQESAVNLLREASPRCSDIYVFADGSGLWEKRQDDWFPADEDTIAELLAEDNDNVEDGEVAD